MNILTNDELCHWQWKRVDIYKAGKVKNFSSSNLVSEKSVINVVISNHPETAQIQFNAFISNILIQILTMNIYKF